MLLLLSLLFPKVSIIHQTPKSNSNELLSLLGLVVLVPGVVN